MPFKSEKQRRYLHANHPEIANRWEAKYGLGGIAELNTELNSLPEYYMPFPAAQGGLIPAHQAGIYGLAEGGRTGFFTGAQADTASGKSMSPGTSASGGGRDGPPGQSTVATHQPTTITTPTQIGPREGWTEDDVKIAVKEGERKKELRDLALRDAGEKTEKWEQAQKWQKPNKFLSFLGNAALAVIPGLLPAKLATT